MTWEKIMEWGATHGVNLLAALAILAVGYFVARIARRVVRQLLNRAKVDATVSSFVTWLVYFGILVVALVATLARFGIETASFVALFGAVAFAIGFALQGALSNFAAGVLILIFRPYKVGDFIAAGGASGTVREIQLFSTEVVTPTGLEVIIPNGKILSDNITNHSAFDPRPLDISVGISYNASIERAVETLLGLGRSDKRFLADPAPRVFVTELANSSVIMMLRVWVPRMAEGDFHALRFELLRRVKETLDAQGIEIPFPQHVVHLQQPALGVPASR
ncbi:MAG: Small-conductance mechanosensitive channel [Candidatus Bipolaricaulis sibiricus]|uniref:Small-conductance mechanosensitive channel n=1 Tax=Bipolaricaulis sibiricus TaxID=2501609 RepID=A0A410FSE1_BIPS1|nr:MAG: Small-conductance mechanosensitive channel [Candidatus Bipolaricaulis sibiricus]